MNPARRRRWRSGPASAVRAPWRRKSALRELADVVGDLEEAEGAAALGVHDPLGHALAVEVGHLLDQVVVLEQDRPVRAGGERVVVARRRDARRRWWWEEAWRGRSSPVAVPAACARRINPRATDERWSCRRSRRRSPLDGDSQGRGAQDRGELGAQARRLVDPEAAAQAQRARARPTSRCRARPRSRPVWLPRTCLSSSMTVAGSARGVERERQRPRAPRHCAPPPRARPRPPRAWARTARRSARSRTSWPRPCGRRGRARARPRRRRARPRTPPAPCRRRGARPRPRGRRAWRTSSWSPFFVRIFLAWVMMPAGRDPVAVAAVGQLGQRAVDRLAAAPRAPP